MGRITQPYRKSMAGSIGAGMTSLFAGSQKRYYILEHRVSSKYHKMGEAQEIIVNQIELGRDSHCQVRFDESFDTVSRRHAAIVKDGERWKLIQLSQTNSTLLNGQKIQKEWYLQNGDEIQLSINGPKLGFIMAQGGFSVYAPTPSQNILAQRMSGKSVTFASWQRNIPHSTTRH